MIELMLIYAAAIGIPAIGIAVLFLIPSGCPKCGFFTPCPECEARMNAIDDEFARAGE